jgi:hypothetical protein
MRTRTGDHIETVKQDVLDHSHIVEQCSECGHDDLPERIRAEHEPTLRVGQRPLATAGRTSSRYALPGGPVVATGKVRCAPPANPSNPANTGGTAMTITGEVVLYAIAVILLVLGALGVGGKRVALGWAGLAVAVFTFGVLPAF